MAGSDLPGDGVCSPAADTSSPDEVQISCHGADALPAVTVSDRNAGVSAASRIARLAIQSVRRRAAADMSMGKN